MATLHPTTTRPARPRWLSFASELASDIIIMFIVATVAYMLLALEVTP